MIFYIVKKETETEPAKVMYSSTSSLPFNLGDYYVVESPDNYFPFPIPKIDENGQMIIVNDDAKEIKDFEIRNEIESIKSEIMSEDYSTGTIPQLRKLARLRQLELILASGSF